MTLVHDRDASCVRCTQKRVSRSFYIRFAAKGRKTSFQRGITILAVNRPLLAQDANSILRAADHAIVAAPIHLKANRVVPTVLVHGDYELRTRIRVPSLKVAIAAGHIHAGSSSVSDLYKAGPRGRRRGLSTSTGRSGRNAPAASGRLDHPRLDGRFLHEDALLLCVGPDCVSRNRKRLMTIMGHVAGLEGHLMGKVTLTLRQLLKEIYGIRQREYLSNQALPFLQIDGPIEQLRDHFYLTENVGHQQGKRRVAAPRNNLRIAFLPVKTRVAWCGDQTMGRALL